MKEIGSLIQIDEKISERVEEIKSDIIGNKRLLKYCKLNKIEITEAKLKTSLMNLLQFIEYHDKCDNCPGLDSCRQKNQGFKPILKDNNNFINLQYVPCDHLLAYQAQKVISQHIKSFYMPKKILSASLDSLDLSESRIEAVRKIANFAKTYTPDKFQKGVYLTGPFGVGKTYLLAAMAQALAKRHIPVALVYLPDMIRELKSAIGNNNLEELLMQIKTVQVLILDDIGSEMNTQWVRDEILGPILQYRMQEELPTFFTSNKSIEELIRDYATTTDQVKDELKAKRIRDRIKALADEISVSGKNYRY